MTGPAGPVDAEIGPEHPEQPYPGLRPFTASEWPLFFGRESMTQDVVARVVEKQFVAVHGDSGCGKSSLIAAGVMPFLEHDQARAGGSWSTMTMRPEDNPLGNLARALAGADGSQDPARARDVRRLLNRGSDSPAAIARFLGCGEGRNVCILFDQFEELFEHARRGGGTEAGLITDFLVGLTEQRPPGLHAILTMRSDYLGQCAQYRGFAETVNETQYLVPRMERPALMRAIREPAALFGGAVDMDLAARLIADAGIGQDQLPLIQHGLMLMWRRKAVDGRAATLTLDDYRAEGDLAAQLSRHADAVMAEAITGPDEEIIVEKLFRALTDRNPDGLAIRRRQSFADLVALTGAPRDVLARIVDRFRADDASFLRPYGSAALDDGDIIDVSHEAFIRNWQRISAPGTGWLDREADDGLIWTSLRIAAATFAKNPEARLSPAAAEERAEWLKTHNGVWAERYRGGWDEVSQLVDSSREAIQRAQQQRASRRRNMVVLAAVASTLVFGVLAAYAAMQSMQARTFLDQALVSKMEAEKEKEKAVLERSEADRQRQEAERQRQAAEVQREQSMKNETGSIAALSGLAYFENGAVEGAQLALAAWPRVGDELRPALGQTIASLGRALPELQERLRLTHEQVVNFASYSADGKLIATASADKFVHIYDASTGNQVTKLSGHEGTVYSATFSPDGTRIVTTSADKTARIWDVATSMQLVVLTGHADEVSYAEFSPDGTRVVTASNDKSAIIWDAATGNQIRTLSGHGDAVASAAFSADGRQVLTGSWDKTARIWNVATGEFTTLTGHEDRIYSAKFAPDGRRVLTTSRDKTARIWDATTAQQLISFNGHDNAVNWGSFSPDGRRVVTGSWDNTARIWDAVTGLQILVLRGHNNSIWSTAFAPDGNHVLTASNDKTARVWDTRSASPTTMLTGHTESVLWATYSPDGKSILTTSTDKTARLWNAATGRQTLLIDGFAHPVIWGAFSPDQKFIVTGSQDGPLVWDAASGRKIMTFPGHDGVVWCAVFSPDGKRIVTASADKTARVWDAASGAQLLVLDGHTADVVSAAFSPDGTRIVTSAADSSARIWDALTGEPILTIKGHENTVNLASFSPDGRRIVTASRDKTARVWDAATGKELLKLSDPDNPVWSAFFSADGTRIVTASAPAADRDVNNADNKNTGEKSVRVWDAATGAAIMNVSGLGSQINSASFSPDGHSLVIASGNNTAGIRDISSLEAGDVFQIACERLGANTDLAVLVKRYGLSPMVPLCGDHPPEPIGSVTLVVDSTDDR